MPTAVSKVAKYAADPERYLKDRGKPRCKTAVRAGNRFHVESGQARNIFGKFTKLGVVLVICFMVVKLLGLDLLSDLRYFFFGY